MNKHKNTLFYLVVTGGLIFIMYWIIQSGIRLEPNRIGTPFQAKTEAATVSTTVGRMLAGHAINPLPVLILQVITILISARLFGLLFIKIGQPPVIGEVVAGIFLGPSIIGHWFPSFTGFLFPAASLMTLQLLSQIGLMLFMFIIGMELDLATLRQKARAAIVISHASIMLPLYLGCCTGLFFVRRLRPRKYRLPAIACAAADDVTAWFLLAGVIAIAKCGSLSGTLITILLTGSFVILMLRVIKPFLQRMMNSNFQQQHISLNTMALIFAILLGSSYLTELIGIHALFGAFMAGIIMPASPGFREKLSGKVEHVSLGLLLPLFFAISGLRTRLGSINTYHAWAVCSIIILVAVAGKFGASMVASRFVGQTWKQSIILGALINTRGLMELIVLNIGYDLGILNANIFTIIVLMALITTFMTGPVIDYMNRSEVKTPSQVGY